MVVPVPCTLDLVLKLLTRVSPLTRWPVVCGTTVIPYGLTSPLAGTVLAIRRTVCSLVAVKGRGVGPGADAGGRRGRVRGGGWVVAGGGR